MLDKKGILWLTAAALAALFLPGCGAMPVFSQQEQPAALEFQAPAVTPAPTPQPTPAPTPQPTPSYLRVGAVGDIMMMQSQISGAWSEPLGEYDFTPSFMAMQEVFQRADILCCNLEVPLAGEENGGYSGPAPAQPTPGLDGVTPEKERQTFNAPDALATSLKTVGFDVVTTANNHCLDRGVQGALRTVEVLHQAGIKQTGVYLSRQDREGRACVMEANGIRIGLIGWTFSVNGNEGKMSADEREWMVGRTGNQERMVQDIALCREAGAEFIIAFPHWDVEFESAPASSTRKLAAWLLEQGVDAVLGSHPHVVQPVEYLTVEREAGPYTGLVAFSMGNFLSNMFPAPKNYGMYLELTLEKDPFTGQVRLYDAGYLPTLCSKSKVEGRTLHQVWPGWPGQGGELEQAYDHVKRVCGEAIRVLSLQGENPAAGKTA